MGSIGLMSCQGSRRHSSSLENDSEVGVRRDLSAFGQIQIDSDGFVLCIVRRSSSLENDSEVGGFIWIHPHLDGFRWVQTGSLGFIVDQERRGCPSSLENDSEVGVFVCIYPLLDRFR